MDFQEHIRFLGFVTNSHQAFLVEIRNHRAFGMVTCPLFSDSPRRRGWGEFTLKGPTRRLDDVPAGTLRPERIVESG